MQRLAALRANGIRLSYEPGYTEVGGRTLYLQFQVGIRSDCDHHDHGDGKIELGEVRDEPWATREGTAAVLDRDAGEPREQPQSQQSQDWIERYLEEQRCVQLTEDQVRQVKKRVAAAQEKRDRHNKALQLGPDQESRAGPAIRAAAVDLRKAKTPVETKRMLQSIEDSVQLTPQQRTARRNSSRLTPTCGRVSTIS